MHKFKSTIIAVAMLAAVGCAATNPGSAGRQGYVEIANPAYTMSPNAPETIWVPRSYVDNGVPRGGELVKKGYEAIKAPAPVAGQAGIVAPGGKPASLIPRFGQVVTVDKDRVYFNIGQEAGITIGDTLKVYRGGTVVEGLGLAPGETVGTVEVLGFVGSKGGYGVMKQGGPAQMNDLVGE
ncbi:hypothetical protein [Geotalea sp. SG265]|uniref:hypothetical protein n=1 Tax=Geotalea sp. SG265 TaxID=2922867 RepID=UPI001FAF2D2C|nr:hypothetical protein [Geotalea sp. SG265]